MRKGQRAGRKKGAGLLFWGAALAAAGIGGFYLSAAQAYRTVFFPHTFINGVDVSNRSLEEAAAMIWGRAKEYCLEIETRTGTERLEGKDFGLAILPGAEAFMALEEQKPYEWGLYLGRRREFQIPAEITYDQAAFRAAARELDCMKPERMESPADACLSPYISGTGYEIVPEKQGTALDQDRTEEVLREAVETLEDRISLEQAGCYRKPSVDAQDPSLAAERDARNRYVNLTVTYSFGAETQVLDGSLISQWLVKTGDQISLDEGKVREYVAGLAGRYDTAGQARPFETSYGQTVTVAGDYGWRIDQEREAAELTALLHSGQSAVREPVYASRAAAYGSRDYGNTYVEVNLTAQHLFLYQDGARLMESDFVSGNQARGYDTPPGIFSLAYKQRNAVLRGPGYASPVKFWMPFNGGIGFHDAGWRSSFGGTIYKRNGSHGCINMPYEAAKVLFENVYLGIPVICYHLPGTESG